MKLKIEHFIFLIACGIKIILSFVLTIDVMFLIANLILVGVFSFMLIKKYRVHSYIPFVMLDFIIQSMYFFEIFGYEMSSLLTSCLYFLLSSGFMYYLLICDITKLTNKKILHENIDKGILALENNEYDLAIELFQNAIRDYKTNYLGYMGMCNTLTKMDEKNLKKIKYYKKKCIRYAPSDLKETINNKY